ncbi:uncharacterized protein TrAtP1_001402 [Trichoderma atroviride]|uniref:uncharacterized protein n=1 Tax=Hypocrea atroviridis TaxID=63577 RepID=UPI00331847BB|nr:hypothetical protein TrAtP1_001402 [Trichoderma atroviride]
MSLNPDIQSSQTRTKPSSNADTSIESMPDPKESSDDQSVNQKVIKPWMKLRGDIKETEMRLYDQAYELFKLLREALEYALKHEQLPSFIIDITDFFIDENREYRLDDCIRWLILNNAVQRCPLGIEDVGVSAVQTETVEETITGEKNSYIIIIRIITELWPHFPFICLDNSRTFHRLFPETADKLLVGECYFRDSHTKEQMREFPSTPLHRAAGKGNGKVIKYMIHSGRRFQPDDLLQILKLHDPDQRSGKTALSLAAIAENLGALHALLDFDASIADTPDTTFEEALKKGKENVVEAFLQQPELRRKFATTDYILLAIQPLKEINE